ncbi:hypothetical protein [Rummeliibacillus stabekisii]|uniref:Uncharacterized protein n=1 Tax=Rummeliibacillus stabekisii TaxID=241244 RepID=A0A143H8Z2_9BACL|nr:hypothetical protein [Rummeliibacillus stabekisii]AMW97935.1 hypothetical protein ATY39_00040 [Rummeliibacillus stabekisii]
MTTFNPEVYEDEKVATVLQMLKEGYSQDEIVEFYGNKNWKSIDMYFRRKGFRWKHDTFVPFDEEKEQERKERLASVQVELTKPAKIIRALEKEQADILEISVKNGFESIEELGQYMMNKGYKWDSEKENYVEYFPEPEEETQSSQSSNIAPVYGTNPQFETILTYLIEHETQLKELLETEDKQLPTFKVRGGNANKTLTMNSRITALLVDYSDEHNMTQKTIVETALIEFFQKYGYKDEVNRLFHP